MREYFRTLFRDGIAAVNLLASILSLALGITGISAVPRWMWLVIAYVALWYGGFRVWQREHSRAERYKLALCKEYVQLIDASFKRRIHGTPLPSAFDKSFLLHELIGEADVLDEAIVEWKAKYSKERQSFGLSPLF